jgi:uncharacterized membrane protein YgaE (UPF0421/DUF939 family)
LKLQIYEHLLNINAAFDQVCRSLVALRKHHHFHSGELSRFRRQSHETRASLNSYLTAIIESAETEEAGRRFRQRLAQERKDEGSQKS